jgi:hypothetical protein
LSDQRDGAFYPTGGSCTTLRHPGAGRRRPKGDTGRVATTLARAPRCVSARLKLPPARLVLCGSTRSLGITCGSGELRRHDLSPKVLRCGCCAWPPQSASSLPSERAPHTARRRAATAAVLAERAERSHRHASAARTFTQRPCLCRRPSSSGRARHHPPWTGAARPLPNWALAVSGTRRRPGSASRQTRGRAAIPPCLLRCHRRPTMGSSAHPVSSESWKSSSVSPECSTGCRCAASTGCSGRPAAFGWGGVELAWGGGSSWAGGRADPPFSDACAAGHSA